VNFLQFLPRHPLGLKYYMHIRDGNHMFLMEYIENFENMFNYKFYPYLTCGLNFHPKKLAVEDSQPPQALQTEISPSPLVVHVSCQPS
jgi:hypothetical protein